MWSSHVFMHDLRHAEHGDFHFFCKFQLIIFDTGPWKIEDEKKISGPAEKLYSTNSTLIDDLKKTSMICDVSTTSCSPASDMASHNSVWCLRQIAFSAKFTKSYLKTGKLSRILPAPFWLPSPKVLCSQATRQQLLMCRR